MTLSELKPKIDDQLIKDIKEYYSKPLCYMPPSVRFELELTIISHFFDRLKIKNDTIAFLNRDVSEFIECVYETHIHIDKPIQTIVATHKNGRSPKEKEKRSREDFIKNTLPKLDAPTQRHFKNKYKGKGYKGI